MPGTGGRCAACELLLAETQLMMLVPSRDDRSFARLHADCYTLWNAERDGAMNGHQPNTNSNADGHHP